MFEKILVPVDLTRKNERAVETAAELAAAAGGEVALLHVIEPLDLPFEELEEFYAELERRAEEAMTGLAARLKEAGLEPRMHVVYGDRAREIVAFAHEEGFDLVVLTSHELQVEDPSSLGTISHKVAVLSRTPVLLVR